MGKTVNANTLREFIATSSSGKDVHLPEDSVLTPSAKDLAKEMGLNICRGGVQVASFASQQGPTSIAGKKEVASAASRESCCAQPANLEMETMVRQAMADYMKPACPNPHAVHFKAANLVHQDFDKAPPGQKVTMTDVITARDSNLAAGFMKYDHSQLPWHVTYDEMDYVIEGEFVLKVNEQVFHAGPGDVLYIPKDSQVVFASPSTCTVFYAIYPANWEELCD